MGRVVADICKFAEGECQHCTECGKEFSIDLDSIQRLCLRAGDWSPDWNPEISLWPFNECDTYYESMKGRCAGYHLRDYDSPCSQGHIGTFWFDDHHEEVAHVFCSVCGQYKGEREAHYM